MRDSGDRHLDGSDGHNHQSSDEDDGDDATGDHEPHHTDQEDPDEHPVGSSENEDEINENEEDRDEEEDGEEDRIGGFRDSILRELGSETSGPGWSNALHALSGMMGTGMSSMSSRLRELLSSLRQRDDPTIQLIALQELSNLLLVSNDDTLGGQFTPDPFVEELVNMMDASETGEDNPEIMLMACRCLANMMEASSGSVSSVVYGGAVPVLCSKLLDIQFIDLAEQALSTLAKISLDFPANITRAGGLTACLTYLDFFPTSTQRTAVTTAANCCRNLPTDSFEVVKDVMSILLNVLSSSDQKVVEQGCLCVSRIVESFRYQPDKMEQLIAPELLQAVLRLLVPGTTNLIGQHIHTRLLRVLAFSARSSPRLAVELLKMNVVDTLCQILTGVSPSDDDNEGPASTKVDPVRIMQALIHIPREQVFETLNVICELLPDSPGLSGPLQGPESTSAGVLATSLRTDTNGAASNTVSERSRMLDECKPEIHRFVKILMPILTDTYSSTVNMYVRQKVLLAQTKMLQHLDTDMLHDALRNVSYAPFLAAILAQKDQSRENISLVALALQCAFLLFLRLDDVYQYQFHREGVIHEIKALSEKAPSHDEADEKMDIDDESRDNHASEDDDDLSEDDDDDNDSSSSDEPPVRGSDIEQTLRDVIIFRARDFMKTYEATSASRGLHCKAEEVMDELQRLLKDLENFYSDSHAGNNARLGPAKLKTRVGRRHGKEDHAGYDLFRKLTTYFEGDALEGITSSEVLSSGAIDVLLRVFQNCPSSKVDFMRAFMAPRITRNKKISGTASITPFNIFVGKLHDLLSRSEHFEVFTAANQASNLLSDFMTGSVFAPSSNATSMLTKQMRIHLIADEDANIPRGYRDIMISVHAIATFKTLGDYLQPRIMLLDRSSEIENTRKDGAWGASRAHRRYNPLAAAASTRDSSLAGSAQGHSHVEGPGSKGGSKSEEHSSTEEQKPSSSLRRDDDDNAGNKPLECADERCLSDEHDPENDDEHHGSDDEEDEEENDQDDLDAIVDDLEDDLAAEHDRRDDPSAVNVVVGSSKKSSGNSTPQPSATLASSSSRQALTSSADLGASLIGRSKRNEVATATASQSASASKSWHIEFRVNDKPIQPRMTIYGAVHAANEIPPSSFATTWGMSHTIRFRRVEGPPPKEPTFGVGTFFGRSPAEEKEGHLPRSLEKNQTTAAILQLLRCLHEINSNVDQLQAESVYSPMRIQIEPPAQFINTKLTAKLNRQLEEPLIVASNCLPIWSADLAWDFPFLFPFETRHLFLQSTSFGYERSMNRWRRASDESNRRDTYERQFFGRLSRQKVRIFRSRILDSALRVMEMYSSVPGVLEVEYFDEVGTGLGPTLEFYSTISAEFQKKSLGLWRDPDSGKDSAYVFSKSGLFPAPMPTDISSSEREQKLNLLAGLGKFVARAMLDSRIIDLGFNTTFFTIANALGDNPDASMFTPTIATVRAVDPMLANSLQVVKKFVHKETAIQFDSSMTPQTKLKALESLTVDGVQIDDLGLDFTLPGYPSVHLVPNGPQIPVTIYNVSEYLEKIIDMTVGSGVRDQIRAFREGFSEVFPYSALKSFSPEELVMLFGQQDEDWSMETLMDAVKADHGFNMDSKSMRNLLATMSQFNREQRRAFLQFVTGSPKLPIGGFKGLTPLLTVVCRAAEAPLVPDDYLPSVMTCVNYLKLPNYSDEQVLAEKLDIAMREGQGAFHLS